MQDLMKPPRDMMGPQGGGMTMSPPFNPNAGTKPFKPFGQRAGGGMTMTPPYNPNPNTRPHGGGAGIDSALPAPPMPQTPNLPFQNPLNFAQRRANAMALYGPPQAGGGPPTGVDIPPGPPQQGDPPVYQFPQGGAGRPSGGILPAPPPIFQARPGMGGVMGNVDRVGSFSQSPMPQDMMMRIQRLFQSNPQLLMQLLGPHLG